MVLVLREKPLVFTKQQDGHLAQNQEASGDHCSCNANNNDFQLPQGMATYIHYWPKLQKYSYLNLKPLIVKTIHKLIGCNSKVILLSVQLIIHSNA